MVLQFLYIVFLSASYAQNYRLFDELPSDIDVSTGFYSWTKANVEDQNIDSSFNQQVAVDKAMEQVRVKMDESLAGSISQLKSVLMLNSTSQTSEFEAKIRDFQDSLFLRLKGDLSLMVKELQNSTGDRVLEDQDRYEFTQNLQEKWEQATSQELKKFHEKELPRWLTSIRHVWFGIEHKVMEKIKKFKRFLEKMAPKSFKKCHIQGDFGVESSRWKPDPRTVVRTGLFLGFVAMIIWMGMIVPGLAIFLAAIFVFDVIADILYGEIKV